MDVDALKFCPRWMIWESLGGCTVGAAILSKQVHTRVGPAHLQGGAVLGYNELFSACDLNQTGRAFEGKSCSALVAHRRWGFEDIDQEEWVDRRFQGYSKESNVKYMVKSLV